jgi:hypothetical protein
VVEICRSDSVDRSWEQCPPRGGSMLGMGRTLQRAGPVPRLGLEKVKTKQAEDDAQSLHG